MKTTLRKIIIFNTDGESRSVTFDDGLNIITGDSKTGKSALLEIIDYCLFSSRSTIPVGVISDFAESFSIILEAEAKSFIITRPAGKKGSKASLIVLANKNHDKISHDKDILLSELRPLKETQEEFERHLGLSVLNPSEEIEHSYTRPPSKVSIRSSLSLLLQHQNLIANKHSLFYRFDDFQKRKKTIEDFPVLIGWTNNDYYDKKRQLKIYEQELRSLKKALKQLTLDDEEYFKTLRSTISPYLTAVNQVIPDGASNSEITRIAKRLPPLSKLIYSNVDTSNQLKPLRNEIDTKRQELAKLESSLYALRQNASLSGDHSSTLSFLDRISSTQHKPEESVCPICHCTKPKSSINIESLNKSRAALKDEISKLAGYNSFNSKSVDELRKMQASLKRSINRLSSEVEAIENHDKELIEQKSQRDATLILQGVTQTKVEQLMSRRKGIDFEQKIESLKEAIRVLKEELTTFDISKVISESNALIESKMNEICDKLDFEKELKPGELKFSLKEFAFHYSHKSNKIRLSEMGSGANWLACHLSLFVSLLYLNCKNENSYIPSFLVIDQPSQVYFPNEYDESDENVSQVKNIFKVLKEQVEHIRAETHSSPQIIVLEHADDNEFSEYVIKRWKKDGDKLI